MVDTLSLFVFCSLFAARYLLSALLRMTSIICITLAFIAHYTHFAYRYTHTCFVFGIFLAFFGSPTASARTSASARFA